MKSSRKTPVVKPGGVTKYISSCPKEVQKSLREIRAVIRSVAPDAIETMSYFAMPGYSYPGYTYNGMFVWFSYKKPFVRLHVRPQALLDYKNELKSFLKTKAVISFSSENPIPKTLVKKLVRSSLKDMKKMS